jgi:hypothetical protein
MLHAYTYILTYMHAYIYTYIHTCIHTYIREQIIVNTTTNQQPIQATTFFNGSQLINERNSLLFSHCAQEYFEHLSGNHYTRNTLEQVTACWLSSMEFFLVTKDTYLIISWKYRQDSTSECRWVSFVSWIRSIARFSVWPVFSSLTLPAIGVRAYVRMYVCARVYVCQSHVYLYIWSQSSSSLSSSSSW